MPTDLLAQAEQRRLAYLDALSITTQEALGQFFTPARAASLIAAMPRLPREGTLRVLDPGAGSGMLSVALAVRVLTECPHLSLHLVAVEQDPALRPVLTEVLGRCQLAGKGRITFDVMSSDFIGVSAGLTSDPRLADFDLVIQNPPYAKLTRNSPAREATKSVGVDVPNLYAAFLTLGVSMLKTKGQLVAITPRSFCNGPYFGAFRSHLLDRLALDRVHVFESRSKVFADTGVLQENIVFSGTRAGTRSRVTLSSSNGHEDRASKREVPYSSVVHPDDPHRLIRIATHDTDTAIAEQMLQMPCDLATLGVMVSTGKVVDFRSRHCLREIAQKGAFPLIYPGNLRAGHVEWPRAIRKAQWFLPGSERDERMLLPSGWYCLVKRFSAKEERRRIVAAVWSPEAISGPVAFENHINVFHVNGSGMDRNIAYGLSMWLNSSFVDQFFRTFSGHTQVNASDLKAMRFPKLDELRELGSMAPPQLLGQEEIDVLVSKSGSVEGVIL